MRDLDQHGLHLMTGDLAKVKRYLAEKEDRLVQSGVAREDAHAKLAQDEAALRYGPTRIPIYNLLLLGTILFTSNRANILQLMRWLIDEAKVPTGGIDLSGSMAISHAISTKPSMDTEVAQILHDAGEDINARNRYGCTPASEICMVRPGGERLATEALVWFLLHGGNVDIKDNDGVSARSVLQNTTNAFISTGANSLRNMFKLVEKEDKRRERLGTRCCTFCGRQPERLLACSKCKRARYCSPPRICQKGDWPLYKTRCATMANQNAN